MLHSALEAITGKKSSEEGQEDCIEGLMAFEKFMVNFKKVHPDQTWEEHMAEIRKYATPLLHIL